MTTPLDQLERQRQDLEKNMEKLLSDWKQWKSEYETLRQDVETGEDRAKFSGQLVDTKELSKIFGSNGKPRSREQIISTLNNRIDYVRRNIETLEKQLAATKITIAPPNESEDEESAEDDDLAEDYPEDDSGLPVTEILEELDDDDNVVSYSLRSPGNNQPQLLQALEKAGLKELSSSSKATLTPKAVTEKIDKPPAKSPASETKKKRKSVTFTEDTKPAESPKVVNGAKPGQAARPKSAIPLPAPPSAKEQPQYMTLTASNIDELMREAKLQEDIISEPVVPADDSEADAQLRRDMLQYNLSELNPVVAELTLEEGTPTDDDDDNWDYDEDDDDDEDQWGRSTASVINEEYRLKMLEIQERLQRQAASYDNDDEANKPEGIAKIRVKTKESADGASKSVRFAPKVDVAAESTPTLAAVPTIGSQPREDDPLSDVVERKTGTAPPSAAPAPKKASRFKAARGVTASSQTQGFRAPVALDGSIISPEQPVSEQQFAPSGPKGQTMTTTVLERASSDAPKEPDEFDADMLKQQAAVEYHRLRNRLIQKQGGFMKDIDEESPIRPLDEEEGGPKRMSRFKAARLAKS